MKLADITARLNHTSSTARELLLVTTHAVGHFPLVAARHWYYRSVLGVKIGARARINGRAEIRMGAITIGAGSIVGHDAILDGRCGLTIGENVNLSSDVAIWTMAHDYRDPSFAAVGAEVTIGDFAWLSFRSVILPGVAVGEGAVVAANATVTRDVEPYTVVAGTPAVVVAKRPRGLSYSLDSRTRFI